MSSNGGAYPSVLLTCVPYPPAFATLQFLRVARSRVPLQPAATKSAERLRQAVGERRRWSSRTRTWTWTCQRKLLVRERRWRGEGIIADADAARAPRSAHHWLEKVPDLPRAAYAARMNGTPYLAAPHRTRKQGCHCCRCSFEPPGKRPWNQTARVPFVAIRTQCGRLSTEHDEYRILWLGFDLGLNIRYLSSFFTAPRCEVGMFFPSERLVRLRLHPVTPTSVFDANANLAP